MDLMRKLKEIDEHFSQITDEELERNLIKAGMNEIRPSEKSGMVMVTEEIFKTEDITYVYSPIQKRYNYDSLPNKVYSTIEVA